MLHSLYSIAEHGNSERRSGVLQRDLIHAIGSSLLAVQSKPDPGSDSLDQLQAAVKDLPEQVRHRLFHLFILSEVILDPLPAEATKALKDVAALMDIDDDFIDVVRDYGQGAYAIAATDLHRKGFVEAMARS